MSQSETQQSGSAVVIDIEGSDIRSFADFHDVFDAAFCFPDFYGRNMNAWIDCMTSLDDPPSGLTKIHAKPGTCVTLQINNVKHMKSNAPEVWDALVECTAFVNWRRIKTGDGAVLALSFHK